MLGILYILMFSFFFRREKLSIELKNTGKINIDVPGVGSQVELTPELVTIEKQTRIDHVRTFIPNVIEPSFVSHSYAFCSLLAQSMFQLSRELTE